MVSVLVRDQGWTWVIQHDHGQLQRGADQQCDSNGTPERQKSFIGFTHGVGTTHSRRLFHKRRRLRIASDCLPVPIAMAHRVSSGLANCRHVTQRFPAMEAIRWQFNCEHLSDCDCRDARGTDLPGETDLSLEADQWLSRGNLRRQGISTLQLINRISIECAFNSLSTNKEWHNIYDCYL